MVKFFTQSHTYDDPWNIVALAYFLRYPNPYASHVLACDVIARTVTDEGTLKTTRLIKKTGAVPKWFPRGFVSRAETWVVEESEVDPEGRTVVSRTKNLDHVKVMQVQEDVVLREGEDGRTVQKTTASIVSNFGFGLTKRIEKYGVNKFKANLERSRQGISVVVAALRDHRRRLGLEPMALGMAGAPGSSSAASAYWSNTPYPRIVDEDERGSNSHVSSIPADSGVDPSTSASWTASARAGESASQSGPARRRWLPSWLSGRTTGASGSVDSSASCASPD